MEEVPEQTHVTTMDQVASVVLDIKSLAQYPDKCPGSPKVTKVLSRKGSNRMERRNGEDHATNDASKTIVVKVVCLQRDQLGQPPVPNRALMAVTTKANISCHIDAVDGRNRRFNRLTTISPRSILFFFATMSSMGTMILIYFTLAINRRDEV